MLDIAVVGATGNVGREFFGILGRCGLSFAKVYAIASSRSKGEIIEFQGQDIVVEVIEDFDFSKVKIVLMSAGSEVSKEWAPRIAEAGAVVIDNSSYWRYDKDVPLVVPEVNPEAVRNYRYANYSGGIIANPNCSTIQMLVALYPIHKVFGISRIVVSTYQSVSGGGVKMMDRLFNETKNFFSGELDKEKETPFSFNVVPQIDVMLDDGYTKEEWKMLKETQKIMDPKVRVSATCVRVPVFVGHSEAISVELDSPFEISDVKLLLLSSPGIIVDDYEDSSAYMTPIYSDESDATHVSRVRVDTAFDNGLSLWVVGNNLRKGAALNAVQIAECLVARFPALFA